MGTNNRQRRAAKKRKRTTSGPRGQRRTIRARPGGGADELPPITPGELFLSAVHAHATGEADLVELFVERLASVPRPACARMVGEMLEADVSHLWTRGWQPADLERVVARELDAPESLLVRCVLGAEAAGYAELGDRVAPDWMGQLRTSGAVPWWDPGRPYLVQLDLAWVDVITASVRLMHLVGVLPGLPVLTAPPADWHEAMAVGGHSSLPAGLLDKVRALLAKAESTGFDAEAEAFTAKAQELMARHRIDRALLGATGRSSHEAPVGRRLGIDDPYAEAKAALLAAIADANGGQAVWAKALGSSTVFAFADELDGIEELFTSLLVQATAALRREGSKLDRHGRSRTTRFRRSFLVAFSIRIGERLRSVVDETIDDVRARSGDAMLPILAARDGAVRESVAAAFPETGHLRPNATDGEGWYAGRLFADQADVSLGEAIGERAAS